MIKTEMIPTNTYYRRILDAPDANTRRSLYLDLLVQPWSQMMSMMTAPGAAGEEDPLAGAKRWAWLLPEQTEEMARLLDVMEAADAWRVGADALRQAAARFEPYASRLPLDSVTAWMVLADPARSNSFETGYTGATDWFQPRLISQFWEPDERILPRLPGLLAHEMHHLIRNRLFPWGPQISVADYIVVEGTAEAFATALFGEDKIALVVEQFDMSQFETARRLMKAGLHKTGFDVIRGYIFGDALAEQAHFTPVGGMPTYSGYAIGYHVVQAFLRRTGRTIEEATFLPGQQIVEESGFFE